MNIQFSIVFDAKEEQNFITQLCILFAKEQQIIFSMSIVTCLPKYFESISFINTSRFIRSEPYTNAAPKNETVGWNLRVLLNEARINEVK